MLMRQMRQNTKIIMLVTALAFVALMVFQWGMDVTGRTAAGTLGRVGTRSVSVIEWQNAYRTLYDQRSQLQEQPITTQQNREIEDEAWDQVVDQILIDRELSRRGIRVSDDEVRQAARLSPPPEFQLDPAFQNEQGQFDLVLYQRFLDQAGQDPVFLQQLELYYRNLLPQNKLIRQVTASIFVPDGELWERWRAGNEEATATFLSVSPDDRVDDAAVTVSDEEVERYYEENSEEFEVPARARVLYTYFDKAPAPADTAAALARAGEIRDEILEGADFSEVALRESTDPGSRATGGSLGVFGRGTMVPALDSAAFSMPVGVLSEPIVTAFGAHLLEVISRDQEADEVEARHILLPIEMTDEAEIRLLTRADSLETLAEDRPLREAAAAFGLPVLEGEIEEEFAILPGVGNAAEAADWAFVEDDDAGVVSPVFETTSAFYLVELVDESPAGTLTLDQVADEIRDTLRAERKTQLTLEEARAWRGELASGSTTLENLAERLDVEVQTAGPFTRESFVPGLGQSNPAVGAVFGTPPGDVAGPVAALGRVLLLRVEERTEADQAEWEEQKEAQRAQVTAALQEARLDEWLDGLRSTTRILDNRDAYFEAAEQQAEQGLQPQMFF
ncbi:MAG: peptidyl-prolyl cis-trans isomerase [Gammaproteobacteria bacterium]|nr:peptidyl-prolyl cis-trans isomerase [Gammaproteobacteria bacterium]